MEENKKNDRPGWEYKETSTGGYWVKIKGEGRHTHKLPFFCPNENCVKKFTGTIDDEYLLKYGFCKTCYVMHVESREKPTIDIEFYQNRLKERGY